MNLFTQYLARFIRRIRLAIGRLHVPHCEDCRHLRPGNLCRFMYRNAIGEPFTSIPAGACRVRKDLCGKHGRYFEPKDKT